MRSITRELSLSLGIGIVVAMSVIFLLISQSLQQLLQQQMATRLNHDSESILAAIRVGGQGITIDTDYIDSTYQRPFSGHYYEVESEELTLYSRSLWDEQLKWNKRGSGQYPKGTGPQQQPVLILQNRYSKSGMDIKITVAEDVSHQEQQLHRLRWWYAMVTVLMLVVLLLLLKRQLAREMRPIYRAQQQLTELQQGKRRVLDETVPHEILGLVHSINHTLSLLEARNSRSRKAVGNVAHAIKTPLARLTQLLSHPIFATEPQLKADLEQSAAQIQRHLDHELKRARVVGQTHPGGQVSWLSTAEQLVEVLKKLFRDKELEIEIKIPQQLIFFGDPQDLLELLGNLLDNAFKWADKRVEIELNEDVVNQGTQTLTIADDGPGIPHQQQALLVQRGQRLDEQISGSGLGLTIAKDIVHEYQGEIELGRSKKLGGLMITIKFPISAQN